MDNIEALTLAAIVVGSIAIVSSIAAIGAVIYFVKKGKAATAAATATVLPLTTKERK